VGVVVEGAIVGGFLVVVSGGSALAVGGGAVVGGGAAGGVGVATSDPIVEKWQGYVQPGPIVSSAVFAHPIGQSITNADTGMIETRFGTSGRPIEDVWADSLAHEQLWHGLLGKYDKIESGTLGHEVGAWKASKPRGISPKECSAIWKKLRG
jgi:hypothetical protein